MTIQVILDVLCPGLVKCCPVGIHNLKLKYKWTPKSVHYLSYDRRLATLFGQYLIKAAEGPKIWGATANRLSIFASVLFSISTKVIHPRYYKHLKKAAQHSHLGR